MQTSKRARRRKLDTAKTELNPLLAFVIWCGDVRSAAGNEFSEPAKTQAISHCFVIVRIAAVCLGWIRRPLLYH